MTINPMFTERVPNVNSNRTKKSVGFSNTAKVRIAEGTYNNPRGNNINNITIQTKEGNGIIPRDGSQLPRLPKESLQRARKNHIHHIKKNSICVAGTSGCLPFWPFSRGGSGKTRRNRNKRSKARSSRRV